MASTNSRTVEVNFDGDTSGLRRAAAGANRLLTGISRTVGSLGRNLAKLGVVGLLIPILAGVASAVNQMLGAFLALPALILSAVAIFAVFKIALSGVGDAVKASSPEGWATATRGMGPATLEAVKGLRALGPQLRLLKSQVQDNFWVGFTDDLRSVTRLYLPILTTGLGNISTKLALVRHLFAQALAAPQGQSDVVTILANTAKFVEESAVAVRDFTAGLIGLAASGSEVLPGLGRNFAENAKQFRNWVESPTTDIAKFIRDGVQGFRDFFGAIGDARRIFNAFFLGLNGGLSSNPLGRLREVMQGVLAIVKDPAVQVGLGAVGAGLKALGQLLLGVLGAGLKAASPLIIALTPIVVALGQAFSTVLVPAFQQLSGPLTSLVTTLGPTLIGSLATLANFLAQYVVPAIVLLVQWVDRAAQSLTSLAQNNGGGLGGLLGGIGGGIGNILGSIFGGRAGGGEVLGGRSYLVGERGPEMLTMGRSGSIAPINSSPGPVHVSVRIGETELAQLVDARISSWEARTARSVYAGGYA